MQMTQKDHTLYYAAIAADDAYNAELIRVYGANACEMRYRSKRFTDAALIEARKAKLAADEARWRASGINV